MIIRDEDKRAYAASLEEIRQACTSKDRLYRLRNHYETIFGEINSLVSALRRLMAGKTTGFWKSCGSSCSIQFTASAVNITKICFRSAFGTIDYEFGTMQEALRIAKRHRKYAQSLIAKIKFFIFNIDQSYDNKYKRYLEFTSSMIGKDEFTRVAQFLDKWAAASSRPLGRG